MEETATLTVRVRQKTKTQLEALAKDMKRSKSFLAAEAIESWVETQAWQIEHIRAAIADADAGRTVPGEKVVEWLESWDTERELPPPECD
jgi:predicted transcriptional regulator